MKNSMLFCAFVLIAVPGFTQSRTQLAGTVTDAKTGRPLAGASVMLAESKVTTTTDSSGNYTLNNIPFGHALVEVSFTGYRSIVEHLDVQNGTNTKNFALVSSVIENETVTITAVGSA